MEPENTSVPVSEQNVLPQVNESSSSLMPMTSIQDVMKEDKESVLNAPSNNYQTNQSGTEDSVRNYLSIAMKMAAENEVSTDYANQEDYDSDNSLVSDDEDSRSLEELPTGFADQPCPVCGDRVSGYHYGLPTCESCKGFFKRTVQNKKIYQCVDGNMSCSIDKAQRKRCPSCRYNKCLLVGMKVEAVRSDRVRGGRNRAPDLVGQGGILKAKERVGRLPQNPQGQGTILPPNHPAVSAGMLSNPVSDGMHSSAGGYVMPGMWSAEALSAAAAAVASTQIKSEPSHIDSHGAPGWPSVSTADPVFHAAVSQHLNHASGNTPALSHSEAMAAAVGSGFPPQVKQEPQTAAAGPSVNQFTQLGQQPHHPAITPIKTEPRIETSREVIERLAQYDLRNDSRIMETVRSFVSEQLAPSLHDLSKLFHNLCWFLEQALFTLVDWARHGEYFRAISVEDQMQLLNSSWSEVLLVEYLYHMMHTFRNEDLMRQNSEFPTSTDLLNLLGQQELRGRMLELMDRFEALQLSPEEFSAVKFLLLFNPGKHDVSIQKSQEFIETVQFRVSNALLDYTVERSSHIPDKYGQILLRLPEIKFIAFKLESLLMEKFKAEAIPRNTLIAEMLISKSTRAGGSV